MVCRASISSLTCMVPASGRKRRAGAPGHDDARHHRPHLTRHAQPDQVGDEDLRAKLAQLHGSHKGQDQANEETDEGDNAEGLHAAFLHEEDQIDAPEAGLPVTSRRQARTASP